MAEAPTRWVSARRQVELEIRSLDEVSDGMELNDVVVAMLRRGGVYSVMAPAPPSSTLRPGARTGSRTMDRMADGYDLSYDPNEAGGDLVVETRISDGPHSPDSSFDPQPGDWVSVGDDEVDPLKARVIRRDGDCVWVQIDLLQLARLSA